MRRFVLAAIVLVCGTKAWAFGHGGSGLEQALASVGPKGQVQLVLWMAVPETQQAIRKVTVLEKRTVKKEVRVNGKTVEKESIETVPVVHDETYAITVWRSEPRTMEADPQYTSYYETDGRKVDSRTLSRRLAKPTLVIIQYDGKPLPNHYAWMFKPGTLVVSMVPPPMYAPTAPEAIPAPAQPLPLPKAADATPATEQPGEDKSGARASRGSRLTVLPVAQAAAAPDTKTPKGPSPQFQFASFEKDGKLNLRRLMESSYAEKRIREYKDAQGSAKLAEFEVTMINRTSNIVQVDPQNVQCSTVDGKSVDSRRLPQLLPSEQAVILSLDGKSVDPFWLQNIKPSVLVMIFPGGAPMGYGHYGHAMPAPVERMPVPQPGPDRKSPESDEA